MRMTTLEPLYSEQHRVEVEDGGTVYISAPAVFYEPVGAPPFFADGGSGIQIHTNAQYHIIDLRVEILSALDTESPVGHWESEYTLPGLPWPEDQELCVSDGYDGRHTGFGDAVVPGTGPVVVKAWCRGWTEAGRLSATLGADRVPDGTEQWYVRIMRAGVMPG